jgi:hypothetical protein
MVASATSGRQSPAGSTVRRLAPTEEAAEEAADRPPDRAEPEGQSAHRLPLGLGGRLRLRGGGAQLRLQALGEACP